MTDPMDVLNALSAAGERQMLEGFLDFYRAAVARKAGGCSETDARRRLGPSETTLGGVVKHLRWVELNWFQAVLAGRPRSELPAVPWTDEDPDADFRMTAEETLDDLLAEYAEECARSRSVAALLGLDDTGAHRHLGPTSLRWVLMHMIEETARHVGHLDILRELLDGTVGE